MTERDFQRRVLDTARLFGWRIYHHRPAMQGGRVVTALEGDAGFPDLILCRPPRLVFAELKVGRNKPSESQWEWLIALGACCDVEAYLWRPEDWESIQRLLQPGRFGVASPVPPSPEEARRHLRWVGKSAP